MEAIVNIAALPQILVLAVIGFIAFYSSCSLGLRASWLAYHPSVCGTVGALGGTALGIAAATI